MEILYPIEVNGQSLIYSEKMIVGDNDSLTLQFSFHEEDALWTDKTNLSVVLSKDGEKYNLKLDETLKVKVPKVINQAKGFYFSLRGNVNEMTTEAGFLDVYKTLTLEKVKSEYNEADFFKNISMLYQALLNDKIEDVTYIAGTMKFYSNGTVKKSFDISSGGGGESVIAWLPNIDSNGVLTFTRSTSEVPPQPVDISGNDGISPLITGISKDGSFTVIEITDAAGPHNIYIADGLNGDPGLNGRGISTIAKTGTVGLTDTYTITFTDMTTTQFNVTNGSNGLKGDPGTNGISPTVTQNKVGKVTTVTIIDVNGTTTLTINDGVDGLNGKGISSISKTGTVGLTDTYTITYSDSSTSTFTITNGAQGLKGDPGPAGYTPIKGVDYFDGINGQSAYELAVLSGFKGTLPEWLSSLQAAVTPDTIGGVLNAAPETVTADDDTIPFNDASDSNKIKKIKLSSIITGIQDIFETIFMKLGSGQVIDDAVTLSIELQKYPKVLKTAVLTTCTSLIVTYPTSYNWNDEYVLYFNTGATPPVPTWPAGTKWFGGATPTLEANKEYCVSFQNGQAVIGNV